jgi:glutamine cyclotransferase
MPHNPLSFTQGLFFHDGVLYESIGQYGESSLQTLDPKTGEALRVIPLDPALFGEGLSLCDDKIVQLTWREGVAMIYNLSDLAIVGSWRYETEGWGLTTDDRRLIMSDGSPFLYYRSTTDFSLDTKLPVTIAGQPVQWLNELEFVKGRVYANILSEDYIVVIDPTTGNVVEAVDARILREKIPPKFPPDPLNGIAYDSTSGDFFLTGKLWPSIFRVRFVKNIGER